MGRRRTNKKKSKKLILSNDESNIRKKNWNKKTENSLRKLQNKCVVYQWVYNRGALDLERKGKILGIFNIVVLAANASSLIINLPYNNTIVNVISAVILYISTVTVGLSEFLQFKSRADQYREAAESYYDLSAIIERTLLKNIEERPKADYILETVDREFRKIFEVSPLVSPKLLSKYEKQTGNNVKDYFHEPFHLNDPLEPEIIRSSKSNKNNTSEEKESNENDSSESDNGTVNFLNIRMQQELERYNYNQE